MKKKILSIVIAAAMVLSQGVIFAEEVTDAITLSYTDKRVNVRGIQMRPLALVDKILNKIVYKCAL